MPVFFVTSGYFAQSLFDRGPSGRIVVRTVCLVWPQLFMAVALGVAMSVICGIGAMRSTMREIGAFWFLKTLTFIYLPCGIICRMTRKSAWRWFWLSLFYLLLLLAPERGLPGRFYWWSGYAVHMLPYFIFGLMVLRGREFFRNNATSICCGAFFLPVVLLEGNCWENGMCFYVTSAHFPAAVTTWNGFVTFIGRTAVGITGSIFVVWLARRVIGMCPRLCSLSAFWTTTLGVYVIHEWFVMKVGLMDFQLPSWSCWPFALICYLVCHLIVCGIRKTELTRFVFFGNENLLFRCVESLKTFLSPANAEV